MDYTSCSDADEEFSGSELCGQGVSVVCGSGGLIEDCWGLRRLMNQDAELGVKGAAEGFDLF